MIARLIAASSRNMMLVMIATVFAVSAGLYAVYRLPLDAIPDLSDTQVIVYTEYSGQAPQVVEDQVTYPLTTAMLTVPKSRVVRGFSYFGVSFVYVIFEDGTDIYWARCAGSRISQRGSPPSAGGRGPGAGTGRHRRGLGLPVCLLAKDRSLAELRTLQDFYVRYGLAKAEGVAEIASVGGFVKQYNIVIDPQRLRSLRHSAIKSARRGARQQHGCRRAHHRALGVRIRRARPGLSQGHSRSAKNRPESTGRYTRAAAGRGARRTRARRAARPHRTER